MHFQIGLENGSKAFVKNLNSTWYYSLWIHGFQLREIINNSDQVILCKLSKMLNLPENTKIGRNEGCLPNTQMMNKHPCSFGILLIHIWGSGCHLYQRKSRPVLNSCCVRKNNAHSKSSPVLDKKHQFGEGILSSESYSSRVRIFHYQTLSSHFLHTIKLCSQIYLGR